MVTRLHQIELDQRAGVFSFIIATVVAAVVFYSWWLWREPAAAPPPQRQLEDVIFTWECPAGHPFEAPGTTGARPCPNCEQNAYPVHLYHCPLHSDREVYLCYGRDAAGKTRLERFSFDGRNWFPSSTGPECPDCRSPLEPVAEDPFLRPKHERSK